MDNGKMKIFSGNSNKKLAGEICSCLGVKLGNARVETFSDGESWVEIEENVRGFDVFVIQSGAPPVNHHVMELLIMIDALKRASARRITAVMPYYAYARQDRKNKPRVPISARMEADLIEKVGASRILTMDFHAGQIQGFFSIPVDNLYASPILLPFIRRNFNSEEMVIVSPDIGGVARARSYAKKLEVSLAIIDKRRSKPNDSDVMNIIGDVSGKVALILDDMADTAGTLVKAAKVILEKGAKEVHACVTHPVLSGPAIERIKGSNLASLIATDTIPPSLGAIQCEKITILPSCQLFSSAIRNIHNEDSVSGLFEIFN
jgi:ribose-phosphate pyrophosphokinase